MNINATTQKPQNLIKAINKSINNEELRTWAIVPSNNKYAYSHTPGQWNETAMLQPTPYEQMVSFNIVWSDEIEEPGEKIKGVIIGRFVEALMVHFNEYFENLVVQK